MTREATQSNPLYCLRVEAAPAATFSPTLEVHRVRSSFFSPRVRRTVDRKTFPSALAVPCVAGISATAALAWSQYYEQIRHSVRATSGLPPTTRESTRTRSTFQHFGGLPQMGTRLISGGGSPYTWTWSNTGSIEDRSISYGAAQCMANSGNGYAVYVSFCWAANF